ncbi:hypothetical protein [Priestia flexa]|uniref:hypothetical protein n=1 Tax=Priestia flexa TaxID=86664 RepID=UPI0032B322BA
MRSDKYKTKWAVCGKRVSKEEFTQTDKDVAKLNAEGKINYLANVPDNILTFETYKK